MDPARPLYSLESTSTSLSLVLVPLTHDPTRRAAQATVAGGQMIVDRCAKTVESARTTQRKAPATQKGGAKSKFLSLIANCDISIQSPTRSIIKVCNIFVLLYHIQRIENRYTYK